MDVVDQMRAKEGYEDEGGSEGALSRGFEDVGDDWDGKEKGGRWSCWMNKVWFGLVWPRLETLACVAVRGDAVGAWQVLA